MVIQARKSPLRHCFVTVIRAGLFAMALTSSCLTPSYAHPGHDRNTPTLAPWQQASAWPDRVITTFETDPTTSFAVTWRTDASVTRAVAEIVRATPDAQFDIGAVRKAADSEPLDLETIRTATQELKMPWNAGLSPVTYHSINFDGLEPDTLYAYRVGGGEGKWSEWFQLRTAPAQGPIKFIYVGDAQNGLMSHWSRVIRAGFQKMPDARFIIHAGDLVNRGSRDLEWAEWFKAVGFIHGMIPAIPVAGNHEYDSFGLIPTTNRLLSALWRPQFRLPSVDSLPATVRETAYQIHYGPNLDIFVLDTTSDTLKVQAAWLDEALSKSTARWRIVTMHHPVFSSTQGRDGDSRREIILPVLSKHKVDLVLQGHDHTYARGPILETQRPEREVVGDGEDVAMMFVNSVSGPKQYRFKNSRWDDYAPSGVRLDRFAEGTPFFQTIEIVDGKLSYRAYAATGDLYDSFDMSKDEQGRKRVTKGPPATLTQRAYGPLNPYRDFKDPD